MNGALPTLAFSLLPPPKGSVFQELSRAPPGTHRLWRINPSPPMLAGSAPTAHKHSHFGCSPQWLLFQKPLSAPPKVGCSSGALLLAPPCLLSSTRTGHALSARESPPQHLSLLSSPLFLPQRPQEPDPLAHSRFFALVLLLCSCSVPQGC